MNLIPLFIPNPVAPYSWYFHLFFIKATPVIGITLEGKKEILGIWIGENETSKYWLTLLNELKNRGVEDILIFAIDGLNGFNQAIQAVYPKAEIQRCIVHQIRSSLKFVSWKDRWNPVNTGKSCCKRFKNNLYCKNRRRCPISTYWI